MVSNWLKCTVIGVVTLCLLPLGAGIIATLLPAAGYYPPLGYHSFSLAHWPQLFAEPALATSLLLSLHTGLVSTVLSVGITFTLLSLLWQQRGWRLVSFYLAPALALPHVAFAIGLSFVIAPSGWLIRLMQPLFGWAEPPMWMTLNDPWGWSLILMLVIKEVPFLLLMSLGVLSQLEPERQLLMARSLGYDRVQAWWKVLVPQLYRNLRLPVAAVLVYGMTVVDAAVIIGPQLPPPMAVRILQWFQHSDLSYRLLASSGALLLSLLTLLTLAMWRLVDTLMLPLARRVWINGKKRVHHPLLVITAAILPLLMLLSLLTFAALLLWSVTRHWYFPASLPNVLTLAGWQRALPQLLPLLTTSLIAALLASTAATLASILLLDYQQQRQHFWPRLLPCIALLIPAVTLFTGLPLLLHPLTRRLPLASVVWGHLLMVFPYVYLSLHGPYQSLDNRLITVARSLGCSPVGVWWRVKRPLLMNAILGALAIGFSVSIVQYLPTLLLSGGRLGTITTEAVAITSSFDRNDNAIYGLSQALLPLLMFWLVRSWRPRHLKKQHLKKQPRPQQ